MREHVRWVGDDATGIHRIATLTFETFRQVDHTCRGELVLNEAFEGVLDLPGLWDWAPWPTHCGTCGREFTDSAFRSASGEELYRVDGKLVRKSKLPVGSMYASDHGRKGPDGMALMVVLPDHTWSPDWRASNCGAAKDDDTVYCWPREGNPRNNELHVGPVCDRDCGVGAGSIRGPEWHGYVDHDYVTDHRR